MFSAGILKNYGELVEGENQDTGFFMPYVSILVVNFLVSIKLKL